MGIGASSWYLASHLRLARKDVLPGTAFLQLQNALARNSRYLEDDAHHLKLNASYPSQTSPCFSLSVLASVLLPFELFQRQNKISRVVPDFFPG